MGADLMLSFEFLCLKKCVKPMVLGGDTLESCRGNWLAVKTGSINESVLMLTAACEGQGSGLGCEGGGWGWAKIMRGGCERICTQNKKCALLKAVQERLSSSTRR